jgi:hypothetical protein
MPIVRIDGGTYDSDHHWYFADDGSWVPSCTQILKLQGLSDFSGVDPAVLKAKADLGTRAHELTAQHDELGGDIDPSWVTDDIAPRYAAYKLFLAQTGFVPDPKWTERPMIAEVYGMKFGVTPDRFGVMNRAKCIVELKNVEARKASWAVQTASQELAILKSRVIGATQRIAVMLHADGKYSLDPHSDVGDANVFINAISTVYWRMQRDRQDLQKKLTYMETGVNENYL